MAKPKQSQTTTKNILLIDDNFAVRNVLRAILHRESRQIDLESLSIYSSGDGVQGLGYVFILEPDLTIIDSTLPKYSGRELIDFLFTQEKFAKNPDKVLIIHDGDKELDTPEGFKLLSKQDDQFLDKLLLYATGKNVVKMQKKPSWRQRLLRFFSRKTLRRANANDIVSRKLVQTWLPLRLPYFLMWLFLQMAVSIGLAINTLLAGRVRDDNLEQLNSDLRRYRVQLYPTLIGFLVASIYLALQVTLYLISALVIFTGISDPGLTAGGDDFKVQRGTTTLSGTTATISAGVDYTAPASLDSAFIRITNSKFTGAGNTAAGGNQNADDVTVVIDNPANLLTSITFKRLGSANSSRVSWEIVEYTGSAAGGNEVVVRDQDTVTYGTSDLTVDGATVAGISDDNDVVVFITGVANPDTGRGDYNTGLSTAEWVAGSDLPRFTRGEAGSDAVETSYAVVEFTGSNWKVQRAEHAYTAAGSAETESITAVNSLSRAFLHTQKRVNGNPGLDEFGQEVWLSSTSQVSFQLESTASTPANHDGVAWIIENTQTDGTPMAVERGTFSKASTGTEPGSFTTSYGPITDLTVASLFINNRSTGTGTAFPRGIFDATLISTSQIEFWYSDNGQTQNGRWEVVGWPTAPSDSVTLTSIGSQTSSVTLGDTGVNLGGAFAIASSSGNSVTAVTIAEQGTIDAQSHLDNIKLFYENDISNPYDCTSESYDGNESQFGATDTDGFSGANGDVSYTDSVSISASSTLCLYLVADVSGNAGSGDTIEIEITNPDSDITLSSGTVDTTAAVEVSGTTSAASGSGYANGYDFRRELVIDNTKVYGSSDFTDFTVMVKGTYSYLATTGNGGDVTDTNGYDIIFTSDSAGSTQLDHEITSYNASTGEIEMWIRVPTLSTSTDTTIFMFYGNSSISTSQENVDGAWGSSYDAIWHFDEASGTRYDSSGNGNDLTETGTVSQTTGGVTTNGAGFSTSKLSIDDASLTGLQFNGDYTLSFWLEIDNPGGVNGILSKYEGAVNYQDFLDVPWGWDGAKDTFIWHHENNNVEEEDSPSFGSSNMSADTWYMFTAIFDDSANELVFCLDDTCDAADTMSVTPPDNTAPFTIGRSEWYTDYFSGSMDTFRAFSSELTTEWVQTVYGNMNSPSTFYSLSGATSQGTNITTSTTGSQVSTLYIDTTDNYVGGTFVFTEATGTRNVTGITLTENGTVDAQVDLDNIKLFYENDTSNPYDCTGESYDGNESQFGSTDTDGFSAANGTSFFSGSASVSTTSTLCVYVVTDITSGASDTETIEIEIADPSSDVDVNVGTVGPATTVALSGTTTLDTNSSDVTISATGTQTSNLEITSYLAHIGGAFTVTSGISTNLTNVTLSESGTVDASSGVGEVRLFYDEDTSAPYDCASESYAGDELRFGDESTFNAANGTVSFTDSVAISSTKTLCLYPIVDITYSASDSESLDISIDDSSTDITVSTGTVGPATTIGISGSTTLQDESNGVISGYNYRREITIDNTYVSGSQNLTDFPVVFDGTYAYLKTTGNGGKVENGNGYDIEFATDLAGNDKLDHEVEYYNQSTGEVTIWIRIPDLAYNADTKIYMFYGNSSISSSQEDAVGVWKHSYAGVWHFGEVVTDESTAATHVDSTGNSLDGAQGGNDDVAGQLGLAQSFDGVDDSVVVSRDALIEPSAELTMEMWINWRVTGDSQYGKFLSKPNSNDLYPYLSYSLEQNNTGSQTRSAVTVDGTWTNTGDYSLSTTTWYHLASSWEDGDQVRLYIDGTQQRASTGTAAGAITYYNEPLNIADGGGATSNQFVNAYIDEVRVSRRARSADWIDTTRYSQYSPATFYSVGAEDSIANQAPTITSVSVNSESNIILIEGATTQVEWTATVTDVNGHADISSAEGKLYRSGVSGGSSCSADDANCYTDASCALSGCSGNSCTATCSADLQFFAEPTDSGTYSGQHWAGWVEAVDLAAATGSATSGSTVDVQTTLGIQVTSSIVYGSVLPGDDTGSTNEDVNVENTGNAALDVEISGTDLCTDYPTCSASTIAASNQEYSDSNFTYGAGVDLASTPAFLELVLPVASSPTPLPLDSIHWGIAIPLYTESGSYSGGVTVTAVTD